MATTKITNPELFDLASLNTALQLPSGTTAERPTSPSTGEWRYNTDDNAIEFYDGSFWLTIQDEEIPPIPSEHFNVVLYTGNGTSQSITGVGFEPDFVWVKARDRAGEWHMLSDSTRGTNSQLFSNATNAQDTKSTVITSFDSDGFSIGSDALVNFNGANYVAWCWKANGGTTSSNTDGTITSTVQVNTKAGFSIIEYTGTGANATLGHGLSSAPNFVIVKKTSAAQNWMVGADGIGWTKYLELNLDSAAATASTTWNNTAPTSTTVSLGSSNNGNTSGQTYVMYAFNSKAGYSSFGSYTGNGLANGPIINTGFEPAWVMVKGSSNAGSWWIYDNKRSTANPRNKVLRSDSSAAETTNTNYNVDFLSNGFQFTGTDTDINGSGRTYIYMAFASDPSTAPVLADSFNTNLYTGNGGTQSITGLGFSPNLVWIKVRNNTYVHGLYDTIRGPLYRLRSNGTEANENVPNSLTSFDSDGFTLGSDIGQNQSANNYVAWAWKANSIPTINTDGNITSVVSVNQAAGFSIIKYTSPSSPSSSTDVVGHGLGTTPAMVIVKRTDGVEDWYIWHQELGGGGSGALNKFLRFTTASEATASNLFNTVNSTVVNLSYTSTGNLQNIAYAFAEIPGFSKFGGYAGNGTSQSVTLGFEPTFLMLRKRDDVQDWFMLDSVRDPSNPKSKRLFANLSSAEVSSSTTISFTSTGFDLPSATFNDSGKNFIYMAFKENPTPIVPTGEMAFLSVAGGGGGGFLGGGAGAGGLRTSFGSSSGGGSSAESNITLAAETYTITIGSGGSGSTQAGGNFNGTSGGDSSLAASSITTITSVGGGYGGNHDQTPPATGGSGGGADSSGVSRAGAAGTANQGFAGGANDPTVNVYTAGGGGGASAVGTDGTSTDAGNGGNGLAVSISGSSTTYAGGGGAGRRSGHGGGAAGTGGGGAGGQGAVGSAGTANTGGGGGGGGLFYAGGNGGSGVVILRMRTSDYSGTTTGSPTVTTLGEETILTYTGSGTYVHS
jgi:hypothetical protein